jgi:hypothetical protein
MPLRTISVEYESYFLVPVTEDYRLLRRDAVQSGSLLLKSCGDTPSPPLMFRAQD